MKVSLNSKPMSILFAVAFGALSAHADPYKTGDSVKPFTAKDQHEQAYTFDAKSTRYLLVSHDMDTGKKANGALTALGKDHLAGKKAIYIANIHGMPGVGRMFALPKMKKYNHRIILGDDAALIASFPEQKDKVTVIGLENGKVSSVQYWDPATEGVNNFLK
ncbi:hypothetical protein OKA05_12540 [Luteolibacter arcticus]|uniref:Uncharacterized protein n=1 Tax=Luteolibacter arcticus TaxID=1581411 RepID=A0ABT3GIP4_9BACT|nr:hypothetical protein [Luteolibacter arcticus]MCW1923385.1 hypothetical protein [Luteolibacter arcticus]